MTTIDFGQQFARAQIVPEQAAETAAHTELADAKAVLADLQQRPDWQIQPGEIDRARGLIDALTDKHRQAAIAAADARTAARQAAYKPAINAANEHAKRLAAESPRLCERLAQIVNDLNQLITDAEEHHEQARRVGGQRLAVLMAAREHGEQQYLPTETSVRIPDVPRGSVLAESLDILQRTSKRFLQ